MSTRVSSIKKKIRSARDWQKLAPMLDALVTQYKVPAYIENDPIQIPHRFIHDPKACELTGLIAALFSYGRRDLIIETVNRILRIMENDPMEFVENFNIKRDAKLFEHFVYRFNKPGDLVFLLARLQWAYREYGTLENLFLTHKRENLRGSIAGFMDALLGEAPLNTYGLKFLFAHPNHGGACKRFNMYLRWMVRQDMEASGRVDFGLWRNALTPAELLVPLDTHILKMNAKLQMSPRRSGTWETAEEITGVLRLLCPEDPVKYDYALFGFSLEQRSPEELLSVWRKPKPALA